MTSSAPSCAALAWRGAVGELFGEEAVLFKDKINLKRPGGSGFTPHQDVQAGWDSYAPFFITMLVSIDRATAENGCLELAAGFHDKGLIGDYWAPLTERDMADMTFVACPTEPGDVVFFDSFAPHRSGTESELPSAPRAVHHLQSGFGRRSPSPGTTPKNSPPTRRMSRATRTGTTASRSSAQSHRRAARGKPRRPGQW